MSADRVRAARLAATGSVLAAAAASAPGETGVVAHIAALAMVAAWRTARAETAPTPTKTWRARGALIAATSVAFMALSAGGPGAIAGWLLSAATVIALFPGPVRNDLWAFAAADLGLLLASAGHAHAALWGASVAVSGLALLHAFQRLVLDGRTALALAGGQLAAALLAAALLFGAGRVVLDAARPDADAGEDARKTDEEEHNRDATAAAGDGHMSMPTSSSGGSGPGTGTSGGAGVGVTFQQAGVMSFVTDRSLLGWLVSLIASAAIAYLFLPDERKRWLRSLFGRDAREGPVAFYGDFLDALARRGVHRPKGMTGVELAVIARRHVAPDVVDEVTAAFYRVRYGGSTLSGEERAALEAMVRRIEARS